MSQKVCTALDPLPSHRMQVLTLDKVPAHVRGVEYAVRGALVQRADALQRSLNEGATNLPFKRITYCNIGTNIKFLIRCRHCGLSGPGNPQQLGQVPLSYIRQTLALIECPSLINVAPFPADIHRRAQRYLNAIDSGSTGAYTNSQGLEFVRQEVAAFIARRDGHEGNEQYASPSTIFLSDGASPAVQVVNSSSYRSR